MEDSLEKRKESLKLKFNLKHLNYVFYVLLAIIAWLGYKIRTKNLGLLIDQTTKEYIPLALDPFAFLRYAENIYETGAIMAVDTLRYFPFGYSRLAEFSFLSYFVVYLHKFLSFFNPGISLQKVHVLYPPIAFVVSLIFFFLFLRKLFNSNKIAILSTAFLAVIPSFLYRTMAGFSDKEALGIALMFIALYLYVLAWKAEKLNYSLIFGSLSGLFTVFMALVWGGVNFLYLTIGLFALIGLFLGKFRKKDFFAYASWAVVTLLLVGLLPGSRTNFSSLFSSLTTQIVIFALLMGIIKFYVFDKNLFKIKDKTLGKAPPGVISFSIAIIISLIGGSILFGPGFIFEKVTSIYADLIIPFGQTRWALTVAESQQPFLRDWINNAGTFFFYSFILGSIVLFYKMIKSIKKYRIKGTILYTLFIFAFAFSRYDPNSVFNGVTTLSKVTYVGSLVLFTGILVAFYFYTYYKDEHVFGQIMEINKSYLFIFIFFILMVVASRSATRLFFISSTITAILPSFLFVKTYEYAMEKIKDNSTKIIVALIILGIALYPLYGFYQTSSGQAGGIGPSYNIQWQQAMTWVRENTPEDAVFAHWWDYGYWVQYGGRRATLSDGGNSRGAINHFVGRHVLTAQSEREALELLKANNVTHLLIIIDEIGKYPAYSSIGSDVDYDRYSFISSFSLAPDFQETRDGALLLYQGGSSLDEDLIYQDTLYPVGSAGIGGFFVPVPLNDAGQVEFAPDLSDVGQPEAVIVYQGQQVRVPIQCLFVNGVEIKFDNYGLAGCLRIFPQIHSQDNVNPLGAAYYLSPRVYSGLMAKLFLLEKDSEYFKLVYTDENTGRPLAIFQGRQIGPLKIWEVSYPDDLVIPLEYYGTTLPDSRVETEIRR